MHTTLFIKLALECWAERPNPTNVYMYIYIWTNELLKFWFSTIKFLAHIVCAFGALNVHVCKSMCLSSCLCAHILLLLGPIYSHDSYHRHSTLILTRLIHTHSWSVHITNCTLHTNKHANVITLCIHHHHTYSATNFVLYSVPIKLFQSEYENILFQLWREWKEFQAHLPQSNLI